MPVERQAVSTIDVLDRVLDKGIVIDYWSRVSVLGIDVMTTITAQFTVTSIETYLRYADPLERWPWHIRAPLLRSWAGR
jgi:hypothetical protein